MKKTSKIAVLITIAMLASATFGCAKESSGNSHIIDFDAPDIDLDFSQDESGAEVENEETQQPEQSMSGIINSRDSFESEMEALLDISKYREMEVDSYDSYSCYSYEMKSEEASELDYTIRINGTDVTLPAPYSRFVNLGWTLYDTENESNELAASSFTYTYLVNSDDQEFSVKIENITDIDSTVGLGQIMSITISPADCYYLDTADMIIHEKYDDVPDFVIGGAVTKDSSLGDIIRTLGNPNEVTCTVNLTEDGEYADTEIEITYYDENGSLNFDVSGDKNVITNVYYDRDVY